MAIPIPRDPGIDVTDVPRHWAGGSPVATAISNGINMLFPHGERFFVRSVYHFLDEIKDPELLAQVKAFSKQEGHHAHAHDELNAVIRDQGFEIDRFLETARTEFGLPDASHVAAGSPETSPVRLVDPTGIDGTEAA